ncbi:Uncharacterized protein cmbei_100900, partial [Cryptosporidium meleagridis]
MVLNWGNNKYLKVYLPAFACCPLCMACIPLLTFACTPVFGLLLPELLINTFF